MPMSSGFWKKSDNPGIFGGGHKKGLWSSGQATPGPGHDPMMDGDLGWDKLEKEYNEDFGRRAENANPLDHQYQNEDHSAGQNQTENISHSDKFRDIERTEGKETSVDSTGTGGAPYHEETMKVTDVRRGGHKRLTDLISNRFSNRFSRGSKPPPYTKPVDCPESGCQVCFSTCVQCSKFQEWHEKDDGMKRCYHEYKDLESRGHYDGTWEDHPENYTHEEWQQYLEEKQLNEEINREMEKESVEMEKLAKEHETTSYTIHDHIKFKYGDVDTEEEMDEDDEKDEDSDDDHDQDYDYDDDEEDLY